MLYPDVIESVGQKGLIQQERQRGQPPETLEPELLEPLRKLFRTKRASSAWQSACRTTWCMSRMTGPGPGLRCGHSRRNKRRIRGPAGQRAGIFIVVLRNTALQLPPAAGIDAGQAPINWCEATRQAPAGFLLVKSVGVMGDGRTYEYVVALRAMQTLNFITAL
jgi:GMP synthase (glutamine-hydrolysing)